MKNKYIVYYNNSQLVTQGETDLSLKEMIDFIKSKKDFFEFVCDKIIINKNNINCIQFYPNQKKDDPI